ncbi:hypothetical protein AB0F20_36315, partial [Streptomyces goshikiensis]
QFTLTFSSGPALGAHFHSTSGNRTDGPWPYTLALFALFAGSAGGTLLGGRLASRWGRVTTVRRAYAAAVPAIAGILFLPLPLVHGCAALAAAALYVPLSLQVTLGQDYLPTRMGTASGVTLGLTVSVGGVASPLIGAAADATSLRTALLPLALLPLLAWALARRLPDPDPGAPGKGGLRGLPVDP